MNNPSSYMRFLVPTLIGAAILRLFHLDFQNLWVDEIMSVQVATPGEYPIWKVTLHNIHGPLHAFVLYLFSFLGKSDWWMRLPSALAGVASIWIMYRWVRLFCNEVIARGAAVLLAISPLHIHYSQEVRNYSFVVFFVLLASYLVERLIERMRRATSIQLGVAVAAAALSNFSAVFLFVAQTIVFFLRRGLDWKSIRRWMWVGGIVLMLTAPWIYRVSTHIAVTDLVTPVAPGQLDESQRLRGATTVSLVSVPYAMYALSVGFSLGPSLRELHESASIASVMGRHGPTIFWVALLFGALAALGLVAAVRGRLRWSTLLLYVVVPLVGTIVLNWQNAKAFNVRYVLVALPAFLCLVAIGINSARGWWRVGVWSLVAGTVCVSLYNYYFDTSYHKEDVRGAVRYVEARIEKGECFFAPTVRHVAEHYYDGSHEITSLFRGALSQEQLETKLDKMLEPYESLWYLRARPWVFDPDGSLKDRIWLRYEEVEAKEFEGVTVFHLVLRKTS